MTITRRSFFDAVTKVIIVLALVMFAVAWAKGQEVEPKPEQEKVEVSEIKIPELNLLRIQNLNLRFQLLVGQRTQIEQELQKLQAQIVAEVENLRDSLEADRGNWNVDLQRGVFVRIPKPREEKKE